MAAGALVVLCGDRSFKLSQSALSATIAVAPQVSVNLSNCYPGLRLPAGVTVSWGGAEWSVSRPAPASMTFDGGLCDSIRKHFRERPVSDATPWARCE